MNVGCHGIIIETKKAIPVESIENKIYHLERKKKEKVSDIIQTSQKIKMLNDILKEWENNGF